MLLLLPPSLSHSLREQHMDMGDEDPDL
eukprot:COSAG01_NODE_21632_length_892_cov_3.412358_1_plen_27_part_10